MAVREFGPLYPAWRRRRRGCGGKYMLCNHETRRLIMVVDCGGV